ncbi:hypothetical protein ABE527_18980 [Brucella sp. TWI432]
MKSIAVIACILAVAGCQTKPIEAMNYAELQTLGKQIGVKCAKQGLKPNTQAFQQCVSIEANAENYNRARNAHMVQQYIELQKASAANRATCVQTGNMVQCY